MHNLELKHR